MKRFYPRMAVFGFVAALGLILVSLFLSGDGNFSAPFGLGLGFIAQHYLFSLTFFVIFMAAAAPKLRSAHAGAPGKLFLRYFLSFSAGSILAGLALLLLLALALGGMNPRF